MSSPDVDLEVADLRLTAGGVAAARTLFSALGFRVRAGERWVVIGPNGSGKSSLLATLAGIFPIASGAVRIDGRRLEDWHPARLAERRAWSPQFWSDPFPATVAETAALARVPALRWGVVPDPLDEASVDVVLDRLDLQRFAAADVRGLSGGERQRVAIATALLQGAQLLLLDEPASHLDPAHQRMLLDVLVAHARQGGAVVASLHDLNLAWDLASHCVLLDGRGGVVAGAREDVMSGDRLAAVFGVRVETIELNGTRRFFVGASIAASDA